MELDKLEEVPLWRRNKRVQSLLKENMFKEAEVLDVKIRTTKNRANTNRKKFLEVLYKLHNKVYRTEFKLIDNSHNFRSNKNEKEKPERKRHHCTRYFTVSDILGKDGISNTEEINGRV